MKGEVFGLLGNGAGKTTTIEILEGYRSRSAGRVSVLGHDPEIRDRRLQERVGIVLQSCGFYPRVTVREAVEHFAKSYRVARDPAETIALVGLDDQARARTNELSGGQRRRLDLALALIGDPELVFLDEPTTGFDPAARRTAWTAVRRLEELGKTVIPTHYLDEARRSPTRWRSSRRKDRRGGRTRPARTRALALPRLLHLRRPPPWSTRPTTRPSCSTSSRCDALPRGERLEGLVVTRPTLEEVYLELTGS